MIAEVAALKAEASKHGVPMLQVTQRAGVNYSTWCRWQRGGPGPTPIYLYAMQVALRDLIAAKKRAA